MDSVVTEGGFQWKWGFPVEVFALETDFEGWTLDLGGNSL
jgi:hypothetical protein